MAVSHSAPSPTSEQVSKLRVANILNKSSKDNAINASRSTMFLYCPLMRMSNRQASPTMGYWAMMLIITIYVANAMSPTNAADLLCADPDTSRVLRKSQQITGTTELTQISQQFDLRYILAIINSRFIRNYLAANMHRGTRKGRIYPDIWKRLPIKIVPFERQKEIALLVEAVQDEYKNLARLSKMGN